MPKITYPLTIAPSSDKFGLHKTETGNCVIATVNSENSFSKFEEVLTNEVSQVVSIFKYETNTTDTIVSTNSANVIATDIIHNGEAFYYKAIKTPILNHDIFLDGKLCYQDNYFVYQNQEYGNFDYYNKDTNEFVFQAFHECVPVFVWDLYDNLQPYTVADQKSYHLRKSGQKMEIIFSKPNVQVKKMREQVYHPQYTDEHCLYFAPFVFSASRQVDGTVYICEYDYSVAQPRQRRVYKEYIADKFENCKLKNRQLYGTNISIYFEQIYSAFDNFEIDINNNSVQLHIGQIDMQKVAKEYGVDISKYNAYIQYDYLDIPELKFLIDDVVAQYDDVPGFVYGCFFYPTQIIYGKHIVEYPPSYTIQAGEQQLSTHKLFQSALKGPIGYSYESNQLLSYRNNSLVYPFVYEQDRNLISNSSVALQKFNATQEEFKVVYEMFKVQIMRRQNIFHIQKFEYVLNENPFMLSGNYKYTDVRNFAATILRVNGNRMEVFNGEDKYNNFQFDYKIHGQNGFGHFPMISMKVSNSRVNGRPGYKYRCFFYSQYPLLQYLKSLSTDKAQVKNKKEQIDYWLAPIDNQTVDTMARFGYDFFAGQQTYDIVRQNKKDYQEYASVKLLDKSLKIFEVYAHQNGFWSKVKDPKIQIMDNEIVVEFKDTQKIDEIVVAVNQDGTLWA